MTVLSVAFGAATAARSVVEATPELMDLTESILSPTAGETLIVADAEHFAGELIDDIQRRTGFDFLVRIPNRPAHRKSYRQIPDDQFTPRWAGNAAARRTSISATRK